MSVTFPFAIFSYNVQINNELKYYKNSHRGHQTIPVRVAYKTAPMSEI